MLCCQVMNFCQSHDYLLLSHLMLYKKLFSALLALALLSSCALRNVSTGLTKYQQAMLSYEAKDYYKANQFFEETLPLLRGKKEEASAYFCYAYCSLYQRKYVQSSEHFKYFFETFRGDPRVEEATYMQGHALYLAAPDVRLGQKLTQEAVAVLLSYLHDYPEGVYIDTARAQLSALYERLSVKVFNSAKLYYQLGHYRAVVITLKNFQKDFPNSSCNEDVAYLQADAQYRSLKEIQDFEQKGQADIAIKYCKEFLANYPGSAHTSVVEAICMKVGSLLTRLKKP